MPRGANTGRAAARKRRARARADAGWDSSASDGEGQAGEFGLDDLGEGGDEGEGDGGNGRSDATRGVAQRRPPRKQARRNQVALSKASTSALGTAYPDEPYYVTQQRWRSDQGDAAGGMHSVASHDAFHVDDHRAHVSQYHDGGALGQNAATAASQSQAHTSLYLQAYEATIMVDSLQARLSEQNAAATAQSAESATSSMRAAHPTGHLIAWRGIDGEGEPDEVWTDRFDALHLLSARPPGSVAPSLLSRNFSHLPPSLRAVRRPGGPLPNRRRSAAPERASSPGSTADDSASLPIAPPSESEDSELGGSEGWSELGSDAEDLFFLSRLEAADVAREKRAAHLERERQARMRLLEEREKQERREARRRRREAQKREREAERLSREQLALMQKTAAALRGASNASVLEMKILANHGSDARFAFLRRGREQRWARVWERLRAGGEVSWDEVEREQARQDKERERDEDEDESTTEDGEDDGLGTAEVAAHDDEKAATTPVGETEGQSEPGRGEENDPATLGAQPLSKPAGGIGLLAAYASDSDEAEQEGDDETEASRRAPPQDTVDAKAISEAGNTSAARKEVDKDERGAPAGEEATTSPPPQPTAPSPPLPPPPPDSQPREPDAKEGYKKAADGPSSMVPSGVKGSDGSDADVDAIKAARLARAREWAAKRRAAAADAAAS